MANQLTTTWPLNEAGELVVQAGVGSSVPLVDAPEGQVPYDPVSKKPVIRLPFPTGQLSALRYEVLDKPLGCVFNTVPFNQTAALSTGRFTFGVKKEVEGHFDAVSFLLVNRAANAISGVNVVVGVSETADYSSSALLSAPRIGGVSYAALQGTFDALGFRPVTWEGAATGGAGAAVAAPQYSFTDWAPKSSINRADGGARPFVVYRATLDGAATNFAYNTSYGTALALPTAPMRSRLIQNSNGNSIDAVSNLALTMASGNLTFEIYPIFRMRNPTLSVWACADSLVQDEIMVADKVSSWGFRACADVSTVDRPVIFANMGCSGQGSATYIAVLEGLLAAGAPSPSVLVFAPGSVNDQGATYNTNFMERHCSQAIKFIKLCQDYRIPYPVMYGLLPHDSSTLAYDDIRKATNAKLRDIAAANGVTWLDFSALGDGGSPERWVPKYKNDVLHYNELAVEKVLAPTLRAALALML